MNRPIVAKLLPGVIVTVLVAFMGLQSSAWIGQELLGFEKSPISGIMMAIVFGLLLGNLLVLPPWLQPGIQFSLKRLLRLGIILLGIRLSLGDIFRFGSLALPVIIVCIIGALLFTNWLGKRLQVSPRMSVLIAVGTSICGATAIVATGPAIDAKDEELAYAVANITIFGIIAMLLYPYLSNALFSQDMTASGLFLGTAIHETAQVAGGGLIYAEMFDAPQALDIATVTKLIRNLFIAVIVPMMAYNYQQKSGQTQKSGSFFSLFPLFIIGFILMAAVRTIGDLTLESGKAWGMLGENDWGQLTTSIKHWSERFLAMAMAGVGLGTNFRKLRSLGAKPFVVGLGASICVGFLSLLAIGGLQLLNMY
jgi:uncharacterized integral membrane protein (TIGR00698 family)